MKIKLSKYQEVEGWLLKELSSGRFQPQDRFYSEQELADRFQVTKLTVRQAYRNMEENSYIVRRRGKGTFVNKLPARPCNIKIFRHCIIGVLTSGANPERDFKLGRILVESHQAAAAKGYLLMLAHDSLDQLLEAGVEGVVVIGKQTPEILRKLQEAGVPAVNYPSVPNPLATPAIDCREAAEQLCRLLAETGHRHLALVGSDADAVMVRQKFEHEFAVAARGMCFSTVVTDAGEFRRELSGVLAGEDRPDVLFVANSWCLGDLNAVLEQCGLVCPADLSMIVHGSNAAIIPAIPPYSYFDLDISHCVQTLFEMLFQRIRHQSSVEMPQGVCHYQVALRGTVALRNGATRFPKSPLTAGEKD